MFRGTPLLPIRDLYHAGLDRDDYTFGSVEWSIEATFEARSL
jgi:hypothetical protein